MKTQKKWIALLLTVAFLWLLQVSAMPLRADQSPAPTGTAVSNPEPAPSFIEDEGGGGDKPKKKSALPIILGVAAVGVVAAVLALVVFKTKYDIVGTWDFQFTSTSPAHSWTWTLVFNGDKKSGTFKDEFNDTGTYQVDGKNVTLEYDEWQIQITGAFAEKDKMSGSASFTDMTIGGLDITSATWTAARISGAAAKPVMPVPQSIPGRKARKSAR
jgi:hypothetical protein